MGKILIFSNNFFNWFFISVTGYCYIDLFKRLLGVNDDIISEIKVVGACLVVVLTMAYWSIKIYNMWQDYKFSKKERIHKENMMRYEKEKQNLLTQDELNKFLNNG